MQNLMHSDFSLGYQIELGAKEEHTEGEDDESDNPSVTFTKWTQPGDSDGDEDDKTETQPDSTVLESVPAKTVKAPGLVPYIASDSEDHTSQESAQLKNAVKPSAASTNTSRFKTPSTADDLKRLSGKTFAESTDKKISRAMKLYML